MANVLAGSYGELVDSKMVLGSPAYGTFVKLKPWYGFVYLSKFNEANKFKIGITSNLMRRDRELGRESGNQIMSDIVYCWSLPMNAEVEAKVKQVLTKFTRRNIGKEKGRTEIFFNIPLFPLVLIIRSIIVYVCVKGNYVLTTADSSKYQTIMAGYFDAPSPDRIRYLDEVYDAQNRDRYTYRISTLEKAVISANRYYNSWKPPSFGPKDKVITQEVRQFVIDTLADDTFPYDIDVRTYGKNNPGVLQWLKSFLEQFTDKDFETDGSDAPIKDQYREKTQEDLEREAGRIYPNGSHVIVTYPDNEDNRKKHPEWIGKWHGRVVEYIAKTPGGDPGYMIQWLEKNPETDEKDRKKWTNTTISQKWVKLDTDIERSLNITRIVTLCDVPSDPIEAVAKEDTFDETQETQFLNLKL